MRRAVQRIEPQAGAVQLLRRESLQGLCAAVSDDGPQDATMLELRRPTEKRFLGRTFELQLGAAIVQPLPRRDLGAARLEAPPCGNTARRGREETDRTA